MISSIQCYQLQTMTSPAFSPDTLVYGYSHCWTHNHCAEQLRYTSKQKNLHSYMYFVHKYVAYTLTLIHIHHLSRSLLHALSLSLSYTHTHTHTHTHTYTQVCWYWKYLAESNELWQRKCLRLGWFLPIPPCTYDYTVWKRHYISCVCQLHWNPPQVRWFKLTCSMCITMLA